MVDKDTMKVTSVGKSKNIAFGTVVEKDTCVGDACPYRPKRKGAKSCRLKRKVAKRKRPPTPSSSPPSTPHISFLAHRII